MSKEHRCFLAIDIESDLVEKIGAVQDEFKKTNSNVKYVEKENLHFTLKFFGNVNDTKINEITETVKKVLSNIDNRIVSNSENEITIEGIGTFPNKNYMKVLWIGIRNNSFLANLQKGLDLEFEKLGFEKEKNFNTHLTIGRIRSLKDKESFKEKIKELEKVNVGAMDIAKISLKKSELTPKGPSYSDIEVFNI